MSKKIGSLFFLILSMLCSALNSQAIITGHISLDSTWESTIYCSQVSSLDDMYRCSPNMIVSQAEIIEGAFKLKIEESFDYELVRLHVPKKKAPVANLIAGGDEENFAFLGIRNGDSLYLSSSKNKLLTDFAPLNPLNIQLQEVWNRMQVYEEEYLLAKTPEKKLASSSEFRKAMFIFSDTCTLALPSILALYEAGLSGNDVAMKERWMNLRKRIGSHSYMEPIEFPKKNALWLLLPLLILGSLTLVYYFINSILPRRKLRHLSVQERRVVELINKGLTNKAIAQELNVEVSTVKSHVYRIFNKLNVKSRNELISYQKWMEVSEFALH